MSRLSLADLFEDHQSAAGTAGTAGTSGTANDINDLECSRTDKTAGNGGNKLKGLFPPFPPPVDQREQEKSNQINAVPSVPTVPEPQTQSHDVCRHCGAAIDWRRQYAVIYADGSAAHDHCREQAEAERLGLAAARAVSAEAMRDPAEIVIRGELEEIERPFIKE